MKLLLLFTVVSSISLAANPPVTAAAKIRTRMIQTCPMALYHVPVAVSDLGEVRALSDVAESLVPPTSGVLFLPGQSPAAIMAYADAKYENYAFGVPFTLGRFKRAKPAPSKTEREKLFAVFKHHLPRLPSNVRTVGIVDYSSHGDTIVFFAALLRDFYVLAYQQRPELLLIPLLHHENLSNFVTQNARYGFKSHPIILDSYPAAGHHLQHMNYKWNAPYGQYYVYNVRDPEYRVVPYSPDLRVEYLALREVFWNLINGRPADARF